MYQVEASELGLTFFINGHIEEKEAASMYDEVTSHLPQLPEGFKVFADMRGFKPASTEVNDYMVRIQRACVDHGAMRAVAVVDNLESAMRMRRLAKEGGVDQIEKYLTPEQNPDWELHARDWLLEGIDPDLVPSAARAE